MVTKNASLRARINIGQPTKIINTRRYLKYRYGNRKFWCKGFYVDTVGRNKKVIENYIRNQLQEDIVADQISMEEYLDPFTGEKNKKRKKKE
ncbi:hypothetical protein D5H01_08730 [Staphylococcus aureus]|nr:hypothetical protein D5H01_08730 [Staphylococcus aureus]